MPSVFFYISGHGFGHATRQIEVINRLGTVRPDVDIVIRTAASRRLLERTVTVPVTVIEGASDTGVVQMGSLELDEAATISRAAAFYRTLESRVGVEADLLRRRDARLVVADAPPLACAAAAAAAIPAVVLANFTWDWIYEAYRPEQRAAPDLVRLIREAYGEADAWRLPMHGGFESFRMVRDIPFVARHGRGDLDRGALRSLLGLRQDRPVALVSFGGFGLEDLPLHRLDCLEDFSVAVVTGNDANPTPPPVVAVPEERLYACGLHYEDLVRAVDVVITKPGYGIISDCAAGDTAMVYTSRGHFAEYDVLVAELPRILRCAFIEQAALRAGCWRDALESALHAGPPAWSPATNGAQVAVDLIQQRL